LLALVGEDVELWEVLTGRLRRQFHGHPGRFDLVAFSPDGKTLLSGSDDTTVLVWDVARIHEERPARLSEAELQESWRDLADGDAEKADRAIGTLASKPEQSLPLFKRQVLPAKIADEERVRRLIADLDSEQFTARERAFHELERSGDNVEPALRRAVKKASSLEVRRRIEALLDQLRGPPRNPNLRRSLRAVEVLERIHSPESRPLLQELASGAPEARLTQEAKASLKRLATRSDAAAR
jgi:hypothetical protein